MSKLNTNSAVAARLVEFINSDLFAVKSGVAKSEYWKYHGGQLRTDVTRGTVEVSGESGFYVPQPTSVVSRATRKILRGMQDPAKVASWVSHVLTSTFGAPRLLSYEKAFDAVMAHADVSLPILSRFAVDHRKLAGLPGVFTTAASVNRHYKSWSGYEASANIYNHYYYQNILRGFAGGDRIATVLEIGAGNGNFPSILYHDWAPIRTILIDLPETLAVSIPFLSSVFPDARIVMPNEIRAGGLPEDFDFAFLTVDQLDALRDGTVDLAINCHSFQEMTHEQIGIYFALIQRVCRESGLFFSANRVEKIPCGPDAFSAEQPDPPNRMAEYPWNPQNEVLVHEVSRLSRLVQLDAISVRLERIRKR
jgi:putative sugar O-methyltransferase